MRTISAQWNLSLNCDCPSCGEFVDLLDADDFWGGRKLEACEQKKGVEVVCPNCSHEFIVDLEY